MELPSRRPVRRWWVVAGLILAFGVPLVAIATAALWSNRIIAPDPDGLLVTSLESMMPPALVGGPIGLLVVGWALRLREGLAWLALILNGIFGFVVLWFTAAVWLGGLAGEPF